LSSGPTPNEHHAQANEHAGQSGLETLIRQMPEFMRKADKEDSERQKNNDFDNLHEATDRKIESASNASRP
jgi:hypothetical protein